MMTGVGCEAPPVTPENNESQPLKITSKQHKTTTKIDVVNWPEKSEYTKKRELSFFLA
jgi:hypothetical protein